MNMIQQIFSLRMVFFSALTGAICALGAILFTLGLEAVSWFFQSWVLGKPPQKFFASGLFGIGSLNFFPAALILPAFGGLISALLTRKFAPEAGGGGTDAVIEAFHEKKGLIRPIVPLIKGLATIFTLGSGGSGGKEGPILQIGAGFGSFLAQKLKLSVKERRVLLLAGAAAGLGAVFKAPLGGAISAVEMLYKKDFESDALIPSVISSITSYTLYCSVFGYDPIFTLQQSSFTHASSLIFYALLALLSAAAGHLFVKVFHHIRSFFERIKAPVLLKPALGGLLTGIAGFFFYEVSGTGIASLQKILSGHDFPLWILLFLALLKIFATSFTVGSGGSGGILIPCLFIGGMLGGFVGTLGMKLAPGLIDSHEPFVLVGMAALLSGIANAHLGGIIIVSEISKGYGLLAPLLFTSALTVVLTTRANIYRQQVETRLDSPAHTGFAQKKALQKFSLTREMLKTGDEDMVNLKDSLRTVLKKISKTGHADFIVVQGQNSADYSGMVSWIDLEAHELNEIQDIALVHDLEIDTGSPAAFLGEDLLSAFRKFMRTPYHKIPVLETDKKTLAGYLTYEDFLAYLQPEPQEENLEKNS